MTLHRRNGTPVTLATLTDVTDPVTDPDPLLLLTEDLVSKRPFGAGTEGQTPAEQDRIAAEGGGDDFEQQAFNAGETVRQSRLLAFLSKITGATLSPVSGLAGGGTVVTFKGEGLDGVSGVTFGGTPGIALVKVSSREFRVTTPAHAAGAVAVVIADDGGAVTITNGYTFT